MSFPSPPSSPLRTPSQDAEIAVRRESAESELSEAEPALQLAMSAVDSIKKPQLDEVRAMARPPKLVQTTLEAVALALCHLAALPAFKLAIIKAGALQVRLKIRVKG